MQKQIPNHIGIIMDGNRRWAKENGVSTLEGHRRGYGNLKNIAQWCLDRGIKILSVFAFSTENWDRTKEEVSYLMDLIKYVLENEVDTYHKKNIRILISGRIEGLPLELQELAGQAMEKTKNNSAGIFNALVNYGGRSEIVDAMKKIMASGIKPEQITEDTVSQNIYSPFISDPDLIIRTSGELRTSGFLLWEAAYSELYFTKKYWPDFNEKDLDEAIEEFGRRQRRFGR